MGAGVLAYFFIFKIPMENNTAELNQLNMPISFLNLTKTFINAKDVTALVTLLGAIKEKHRNYVEFIPKYEGIETATVGFEPENKSQPTYIDLSFLQKGMIDLKQLQKEFGKGEEFPATSPEEINILRFTYSSIIGGPQVVIFATLTEVSTNPESKIKRIVIRYN